MASEIKVEGCCRYNATPEYRGSCGRLFGAPCPLDPKSLTKPRVAFTNPSKTGTGKFGAAQRKA